MRIQPPLIAFLLSALALPLLSEHEDFKNLVEVVRPSQPGFTARLVSLLGTRDTAALAPLASRSLIITNNSGHEIQSFTLTETKEAGDGRLGYSIVRNGRGAQANPKRMTISPGASRVATTEPATRGILAKAERSDSESAKLAQLSHALPNASDMAGLTLVDVDLDSVVLDDGRVLGPDRYGVTEEYVEELRALEAKIALAEKLAHEGGVEDAISQLDSTTKMEIPRLDLANPAPERQAMVEIRTSLLLRDLLKSRQPADAADYMRRYVTRLRAINLHR